MRAKVLRSVAVAGRCLRFRLNARVHRHDPTVRALVDAEWYRARYSIADGRDPVLEYLARGAGEGRDPNPFFATHWYRQRNPDVAASELSPLVHFARYGAGEGRDPHPLFDTSWYRSQNLDIGDANPLVHYLRYGRAEGRSPNPLFDPAWYRQQYTEINARTENLIEHYLEVGAREDRDPGPLFSTRWYLGQHPDVAEAGMNPLLHYLGSGRFEGRAGTPIDLLRLVSELAARNDTGLALTLLALDRKPLPIEGARRQIAVLPLRSLRDHLDLEGTTLVFEEPGEPLLEVAQDSNASSVPHGLRSPDLYVASMADVHIVGGTRYVITRNEDLLHDEEADVFDDASCPPKWDKVWRAPGRRMVMQAVAQFGTHIPIGIHLMAEGDANYFHFVFEILPRLAIVMSLDGLESIPLLVTAGAHANCAAALACLNQGRHPVVELRPQTLYSVDRLIFPSDAMRILNVYRRRARLEEGTLSLSWMRVVRRRVLEELAVPQGSRRRLYIRRGGRYRRLQNEREIEERLIELGFESVSLDDLSLRAQVLLFANASHVVAPTGAGVTNLIWCRAGTRALILSSNHPYIQHNIWELVARVAGVELNILLGPRAHRIEGLHAVHDDYTVDVESVVASLALGAEAARVV